MFIINLVFKFYIFLFRCSHKLNTKSLFPIIINHTKTIKINSSENQIRVFFGTKNFSQSFIDISKTFFGKKYIFKRGFGNYLLNLHE